MKKLFLLIVLLTTSLLASICEDMDYFKSEINIEKNTEFMEVAQLIRLHKQDEAVKLGESYARKGNFQIVFFLPMIYSEIGNTVKAKEWFEYGLKHAKNVLEKGLVLQTGVRIGFADISYNFMKKAAESGDSEMQLLYGMSLQEEGTHYNLEEGLKWLKRASLQGCGSASYLIAQEYRYPKHVEAIFDNKDFQDQKNNVKKRVIENYLKERLSKHYNTPVTNLHEKISTEVLESFYDDNMPSEAYEKYLLLAAEQGNLQAMDELAGIYNYDKEQKTFGEIAYTDKYGKRYLYYDGKKAFELYKKAANFGFAKSQSALGLLYEYGSTYITKDYYKAMYCYKKASENGNKNAFYYIANLILESKTFENYKEAAKYFLTQSGGMGKELVDEYKLYLVQLPSQEEIDAINQKIESFGSGTVLVEKRGTEHDDIPKLLRNAPQTPVDVKKWLFVIGVEDYDNTDDIKYAKNSAELFTQVSQKVLGVPKQNSFVLINENATAGKIKDTITLLARDVNEGDTIYFYYNGHGVPDPSKQNEPYILPKDKIPDFISSEAEFALQAIYKRLGETKAGKVVAFVDSCFSGATDGVSIIKGVAASRLKPRSVGFDEAKMAILTAGEGTQYSNAYSQVGHRMFSYFVMKALLEGCTDIDTLYKEVFVKVKDASRILGPTRLQEPMLAGKIREL